MSQTDRQTDKPAIHWNSAIFDVGDNWTILTSSPPDFVKKVYYKKEICPTTGKEHYQTHVVCNAQQRLSRLCKWIKQTNWKPVRGEEYIKNSINYIYKEETTAPGATVQVTEGEKYQQFHELLLAIARHSDFTCYLAGTEWDIVTSRMVRQDPRWANKLSNPALKKSWDTWRLAFIDWVGIYAGDTCGAFIIEAPPDEDPGTDSEVCLIE